MRWVIGLMLAMAAGQAAAAPFCVVSSAGQQCFYYDAQSCQQAARAAGGMCAAQVEQEPAPYQSPQPRQFQPARPAGAPFCVVSGAGSQCFYYDAAACQQTARSMNGACVPNPN